MVLVVAGILDADDITDVLKRTFIKSTDQCGGKLEGMDLHTIFVLMSSSFNIGIDSSYIDKSEGVVFLF